MRRRNSKAWIVLLIVPLVLYFFILKEIFGTSLQNQHGERRRKEEKRKEERREEKRETAHGISVQRYLKMRSSRDHGKLLNTARTKIREVKAFDNKEYKNNVEFEANTEKPNVDPESEKQQSRIVHPITGILNDGDRKSKLKFKHKSKSEHIKILIPPSGSRRDGEKRSKQKTLVIIMTYVRSGSSFTGDIVQQDSSVVYVFEPLHNTEKMIKEQREVRLISGKIIALDSESFENRSSSVIDAYFTCNFSNLDIGSLFHKFMEFGIKTSQFFECYKTKLQQIRSNMEAFKWCVRRTEEICRNSDVIVLKTIRLKAAFLEKLMIKYGNLKLVHLIRDPRGQIYSLDKFGNTTSYNGHLSKEKCDRMSEDFHVTERIRRALPDRYLRLYYEDLAERPQKVSSAIYKFLNLNYTENIKQYVYNITNSSIDDEDCDICTYKKNSSDHVMAWRRGFSFEEVRVIDKNCVNVYEQYGYFVIRSKEELSDFSIPVFTRRKYY